MLSKHAMGHPVVQATHSDWVYLTRRLPKFLTEGKNSVRLRVVSLGYSEHFGPSQAVYRAYTDTNAKLPFERDRSVWCDPSHRIVSITDGDTRIQALEGRKLPKACRPNGEPWPDGHPMKSLLYYYREVRIGPYLIGINSTGAPDRGYREAQMFEMDVPEGKVEHVTTGKHASGDTVTVEPRSAMVLKVRN